MKKIIFVVLTIISLLALYYQGKDDRENAAASLKEEADKRIVERNQDLMILQQHQRLIESLQQIQNDGLVRELLRSQVEMNYSFLTLGGIDAGRVVVLARHPESPADKVMLECQRLANETHQKILLYPPTDGKAKEFSPKINAEKPVVGDTSSIKPPTNLRGKAD